jgi:hypothetical protein
MAASPQIKAVKADLTHMGKKVLLVEGPDDWHAFNHMIHKSTGAFPLYELGHCDNDDGVLDVLSGMTEASTKTQTIIGAVLDADQCRKEDAGDEGIQSRIRSLQGRLGKFYAIPAKFPEEGLILPPIKELDQDRLPVLGIWLMPDNVRDGIFEDLLRAAMAPESEKYISGVVDQATKDRMTGFRDVERPKAIVKTHIAWQNPTLKNLGEAISAKHFDNLLPACQSFLDWLNRLFGESVQP